MKRILSLAGLICCASVIPCLAAEQPKDNNKATEHYAVALSGYDGAVTNQVMTALDYEKLKKQVDTEAAIFKKVLKLTEQDWKSSNAAKKKPFLPSVISRKKLDVYGPYTDISRATDKVAELDSAQKDKTDQQQKSADLMRNGLSENQKTKLDKKSKDDESSCNVIRKAFENMMIKELASSSSGQAASNAAPSHAKAPASSAAK
jgi:hypothetical protein